MKVSNQIKPISYLKAHAAEIVRTLGLGIVLLALCGVDRTVPILRGQSTQSPLRYEVLTSGVYNLESELNRSGELGLRFHSIIQHAGDLTLAGPQQMGEINRTRAIMVSGFQPGRYRYRVISADWPVIAEGTEDEAAESLAEQLNDALIEQLRQAAEDGFYYPGQAMHFLVNLSEDSQLAGVAVILERDNMEEEGTREYPLGAFKVLITVRAGTMERELNEAAMSNYHLQAVTPVTNKFAAFIGGRIVAILAHDESRQSEYRVTRGTNKRFALPPVRSRGETQKTLNVLYSEGFRYRAHVGVMPGIITIFHERDAAAHDGSGSADHLIRRLGRQKNEFMPIRALTEELAASSDDGYRLLGVSQDTDRGVFALLSRPKASGRMP